MAERDDDALVTEFYDTVSFDETPRPWREMPETGLSEDEPNEGDEQPVHLAAIVQPPAVPDPAAPVPPLGTEVATPSAAGAGTPSVTKHRVVRDIVRDARGLITRVIETTEEER